MLPLEPKEIGSKKFTTICANVRGLRTNVGYFTNKFIIPKNPDIVLPIETFLNKSVPEAFGSTKGYSK